jgi:hypothetical protein
VIVCSEEEKDYEIRLIAFFCGLPMLAALARAKTQSGKQACIYIRIIFDR